MHENMQSDGFPPFCNKRQNCMRK